MIKFIEFIGWFCFSYLSTITFLLLKWGIILRDGSKYNWSGTDEPHTLWFLLIIAIDSIKFLYVLRWRYKAL